MCRRSIFVDSHMNHIIAQNVDETYFISILRLTSATSYTIEDAHIVRIMSASKDK